MTRAGTGAARAPQLPAAARAVTRREVAELIRPKVAGLLRDLAASMDVERPVGRVLVVGCEPACLDEGIGLSPAVTAAVGPAIRAVTELIDHVRHPEGART